MRDVPMVHRPLPVHALTSTRSEPEVHPDGRAVRPLTGKSKASLSGSVPCSGPKARPEVPRAEYQGKVSLTWREDGIVSRYSPVSAPSAQDVGSPGADDGAPEPGSEEETVRPLVASSWLRSQAAGAGRDRSDLPPVPLEGPELIGYREAHPLRVTMPVCHELLGDAVRESGWVFAVTDAEGVLMWVDGDPSTRQRISRVNFVEGAVWSEARAGTNAPGTALAIGKPVQIIGREHYNEAVRDWSCAASPLRDPDSGRILGVLDITGGPDVAGAHVLALTRATASAMEAQLARILSEADTRAREAFMRQPSAGASALVSRGGRILEAGSRLALAGAPNHPGGSDGPGVLLDGRRMLIEPVGVSGYTVVRFVDSDDHPGAPEQLMRMSALGRDNAVLEVGGRAVRLSPRHSEIVVLLALAQEGLSAGHLAADLLRDELNTLAIRVDMSRLRSVLGDGLLGSRPYRLLQPVRSDVHVVRDLLAEGRVRDALGVYPGPLLPYSEAPGVVEHRLQLEHRLRAAVLASGDAWLLQRWVNASWGAQDLHAWEILAGVLPAGSPQQAAVAHRAQALRTGVPTPLEITNRHA